MELCKELIPFHQLKAQISTGVAKVYLWLPSLLRCANRTTLSVLNAD